MFLRDPVIPFFLISSYQKKPLSVKEYMNYLPRGILFESAGMLICLISHSGKAS